MVVRESQLCCVTPLEASLPVYLAILFLIGFSVINGYKVQKIKLQSFEIHRLLVDMKSIRCTINDLKPWDILLDNRANGSSHDSYYSEKHMMNAGVRTRHRRGRTLTELVDSDQPEVMSANDLAQNYIICQPK